MLNKLMLEQGIFARAIEDLVRIITQGVNLAVVDLEEACEPPFMKVRPIMRSTGGHLLLFLDSLAHII